MKLITGGSSEQTWLYPSEESVLDFLVGSLHLTDEEARGFVREACANSIAQRSAELTDEDIRAILVPTE